MMEVIHGHPLEHGLMKLPTNKEDEMELVIVISGLIGSLVTVLTFFGIRLGKNVLAVEEKLYLEEAEKRYNELKDSISKDKMFGPYERGGNKIKTPQFEVCRVTFNPETMGQEWKNCKRAVRYSYTDKETGKIMVHGWRL
jgi:hypothetical protein